MVRFAPSQVAPGALDEMGLSVTVAPRRADNPRYGATYDLATFAAAEPVHFHRLTSEQYLMTFSRRWHTATPSASNPGGYTAFTESAEPGWVRVAVPSGQRVPAGEGFAIPTQGSYEQVVLADAVSRSTEYLYLLLSTATSSVVAHWCHNTTTGAVFQLAEDVVPDGIVRPAETTPAAWAAMTDTARRAAGAPVRFHRGLHFRTPHLIVYGTSADHRVFMARKPWGRIGVNAVTAPDTLYRNEVFQTPEDPRWVYFTGEGWSSDPTLVGPIVDHTGAAITSQGPVSVLTHRDMTLMATVAADGSSRLARIYMQRADRPWVAQEPTVPLGTAGSSYLGGTLRFQQQVMARITDASMADPAVEVAIPYVVSTKTESDGVSVLNNTWGLWEIPRFR